MILFWTTNFTSAFHDLHFKQIKFSIAPTLVLNCSLPRDQDCHELWSKKRKKTMREAASKGGQGDSSLPSSQSTANVSSKAAPKPSSGYISVSDVFGQRSQSMTDMSKTQSVSRTTPSDLVKNKTLPNKSVTNKDSEVSSGAEVGVTGIEGKTNEVRVEGKVAENLAGLTQLLLQNKTPFTLLQLSEILNVPVDSSTQGLLEKLNMLLKGKQAPEKDMKDSSTGVQKALAELLSKRHGVSVKLGSGHSNSGGASAQSDLPARRYTQQSSFNATAMSISEESNNSVGGVDENSGNVMQHAKPRESSEHKAHRRVSGHKDPLGLQEPLSAKAKVQNYLERFDVDAQGSAGASGFKPYSQTQWK